MRDTFPVSGSLKYGTFTVQVLKSLTISYLENRFIKPTRSYLWFLNVLQQMFKFLQISYNFIDLLFDYGIGSIFHTMTRRIRPSICSQH